jgi:hypothetical protein
MKIFNEKQRKKIEFYTKKTKKKTKKTPKKPNFHQKSKMKKNTYYHRKSEIYKKFDEITENLHTFKTCLKRNTHTIKGKK